MLMAFEYYAGNYDTFIYILQKRKKNLEYYY